jgi:hypothetical protein
MSHIWDIFRSLLLSLIKAFDGSNHMFLERRIKSSLQIYTNILGGTYHSKVINENQIMDDEKSNKIFKF